MRDFLRTLPLAALLLTLPATVAAQDADPADVASIDAIITAVYDAISGDAGVARDWDRFRSLFAEGATLSQVGRRPDGTVVRGDVASITIGDRTNLQDLTVVHPQHDEDVQIGADVVCGHGVMLHGRTVGDRCLIGMGSILLPGVRIGDDAVVAAGALLPLGFELPAGHVAMGSPAKVVREVRPSEREMIEDTKRRYLDLARKHEGGYRA